jgi:hypothetical protein
MIGENRNNDKTGVPYLMDIPVLGRFFRNTNERIQRTELIMLITPHVIRSRTEGTEVTEELKSKLSTLRNELERMRLERERDVEKMKRQWQDQQKPAAPEPSSETPIPSPSSSPASPVPAAGPLRNINTLPNEVPSTPQGQESHGPISRGPSSLLVSRVLPQQTLPVRENVADPLQRKDSTTTLKEPSRVPAVGANSARDPHRPSPLWTVQVASLNQTRDAENIAGRLKDKGYDAYVVAAEVKSKIWHRVRVGQEIALGQAFELRTALNARESFDQAFIAVR